MWLKLTNVKFIGSGKNQKSLVMRSRFNMDLIETYFEAPEELRNHKSEAARCNTLLMAHGANDMVYHVKETVEEIDDMIAAYGTEDAVNYSFNTGTQEIVNKAIEHLNEPEEEKPAPVEKPAWGSTWGSKV